MNFLVHPDCDFKTSLSIDSAAVSKALTVVVPTATILFPPSLTAFILRADSESILKYSEARI